MSSETRQDEAVQIHVRYANDAAALELQTTWRQFDNGVWKIVEAEKVGS
jgi:hypothetical protein